MKKTLLISLFLLPLMGKATSVSCIGNNISAEISQKIKFVQSNLIEKNSDEYENVSVELELPKNYRKLNASVYVIYFIPQLYERLSLVSPNNETDPSYPKDLPSGILTTSSPTFEILNNVLSFHLGGATKIGLQAKIFISFTEPKSHLISCLGDAEANYKFGEIAK